MVQVLENLLLLLVKGSQIGRLNDLPALIPHTHLALHAPPPVIMYLHLTNDGELPIGYTPFHRNHMTAPLFGFRANLASERIVAVIWQAAHNCCVSTFLWRICTMSCDSTELLQVNFYNNSSPTTMT